MITIQKEKTQANYLTCSLLFHQILAFDLRWDEESKEIVDGLPKYKDKLTLVTVTRSEVVYHELNENLLRTKYGYSYKKAHSKAGGTGESSRFFPEEN